MVLFSTKLYVNGLPVDYNVITDLNKYQFQPFFNPHMDLEAPSFYIHKPGNEWSFIDLEDECLKQQVLEDISNYL